MNNKALTLSLVMAVLAVFFMQSYVSSIEEAQTKKYGTQVVVLKAKRDIKEMETITENMIVPDQVPKQFIEPAAIVYEVKSTDDAKVTSGSKALAGLVAIVPIRKGEQITNNKISEPNIRTGLAPQIAPGKRAIAVPVNDVSGVAKLVKPGDRVDLIAVLDLGGGKEGKIAKTVLQDVVVLAVGHSVTNNLPRLVESDPYGGPPRTKSLAEDTTFNTITLEVEPAQAQAMALVMGNGDNALSIALRNNDDTERAQLGATVFTDVLGPDAARVRVPAGKR